VLVFTRKRDEAIVVGDGIEIRVLRTGRDGRQDRRHRAAVGRGAPP